jgi:hypothetical protein
MQHIDDQIESVIRREHDERLNTRHLILGLVLAIGGVLYGFAGYPAGHMWTRPLWWSVAVLGMFTFLDGIRRGGRDEYGFRVASWLSPNESTMPAQRPIAGYDRAETPQDGNSEPAE